MAAPFGVFFPISLCPSGSCGLCLFGDRPDETRQLTRDRDSDHRRQLSRPGELAIASAQPFLRLPCDVADRLGQALLAQQLLAADACGKSVAQAASISMRRAVPLPALVMPPWRRVPPLECSDGTSPRYAMS